MRRHLLRFTALVLLVLPAAPASAQMELQGQLSTWATLNGQDSSSSVLGIRYLPTFTLGRQVSPDRTLDVELSLNAYGSASLNDEHDDQRSGRAKPYRLWGRYKTPHFEARIGLQKLNFGSATLLRPLMWFDSVDPRDPLQITDGVYGALVRGYFPNKATLWGWGLYGNTSLKGFESNPTSKHTPEFGGRFELPVSKGQIAFTTHHRRADVTPGITDVPSVTATPEHRYALDGKWDVGIGLWFEGTLSHQTHPDLLRPDQRALNVGGDYTFGLGNGLYVLAEYFMVETSHEVFGPGDGLKFGAASIRYPLTLLDAISGIVYVDATRHNAYRFVNWQRSYDRWQFYVMGFWNPRLATLPQTGGGQNAGQSPLAGRGVQIMAVFNHHLKR